MNRGEEKVFIVLRGTAFIFSKWHFYMIMSSCRIKKLITEIDIDALKWVTFLSRRVLFNCKFNVHTCFTHVYIDLEYIFNYNNYNFLACDWFKKVLFSTNSIAKLLSDSLLLESFSVIGQFVIGQFNKPITFKDVVSISQS